MFLTIFQAMKGGRRLWTRDELILAINLYCKLPFGKLHQGNPEVKHLAQIIDRTAGSVAYKLVNFASMDPSLQARGIKGASNASKLDREIWNEFYQHWDQLPFESEALRAKREGTTLEEMYQMPDSELPQEGKIRERMVRTRVNQYFFRSAVLAAYNGTCCITGLKQAELLIAGHISPWGADEANRMNPRNGIAINALHDMAFERGLLTITTDYIIRISPRILKQNDESSVRLFHIYEGKGIEMPSRFLPDPTFLEYHNKERFVR